MKPMSIIPLIWLIDRLAIEMPDGWIGGRGRYWNYVCTGYNCRTDRFELVHIAIIPVYSMLGSLSHYLHRVIHFVQRGFKLKKIEA